MRLLELRGVDASTSSAPASLLHEAVGRPVIKPHHLKKPLAGKTSPAGARVFPINSRPPAPPSSRKPVDLIQLLQRIEELEKRIQQRLARQADTARQEDIEQMVKRIRMLEQRVETELWNARQREHTMLELLARPTLSVRLRQRALQIVRSTPSTLWHWCKVAGRAWWYDAQPQWWPRLAEAWQQAWSKAQQS